MTDQELSKIQPTQKTLTNKERAFIDMYFGCNMNATEAYSLVYPKAKKDSCRSSAATLLAKPNIAEEVERRLTEQTMSKSEVLARLSSIARASEMPFIRITDEGFVYFDFSNPDAKQFMYLIKKIKTKRTRRREKDGKDWQEWEDEWVEVELHDAKSALDTIAKYHGLLTDKLDVTTGGEKIKGYIGWTPDKWDGDEQK